MKPQKALSWLWAVLFALSLSSQAGTWSDHFSSGALLLDWTGTRNEFQIVNQVLEGQSGSPLTPSPFNFVEIQKDSTDCSVSAWVNVVRPNTRVCTKGALLLGHTGTNGYVFALHEATQTAEVYRLENHQMLLNKAWKIDLMTWYFVRAELHGPVMTFFIDGQEVGSVNDAVSPAGAVGLAVQDADIALFDDFTITGAGVVGNVDDMPKPGVSSTIQTEGQVVLRFNAISPYDYFVQASSSPGPSHDWETIATFRAKLDLGEVSVTDAVTNTVRFYRVEKVPCYCR
jgi:hypothetical protein